LRTAELASSAQKTGGPKGRNVCALARQPHEASTGFAEQASWKGVD